MYPAFDVLLVPQGVEYSTVCQGLRDLTPPKPLVMALPVGSEPVSQFLTKLVQESPLFQQPLRILVTGLCGSLTPQHGVGDLVAYLGCIDACKRSDVPWQPCDLDLRQSLTRLPFNIASVQAVTTDRVICTATEKHQLAQQFNAAVVDMEGFAILQCFRDTQVSVAMLRVVSDDCLNDLPDLSNAFTVDGSLKPLSLAIAMMRQPLGAIRLIRGSLYSLRVLRQTLKELFATESSR